MDFRFKKKKFLDMSRNNGQSQLNSELSITSTSLLSELILDLAKLLIFRIAHYCYNLWGKLILNLMSKFIKSRNICYFIIIEW